MQHANLPPAIRPIASISIDRTPTAEDLAGIRAYDGMLRSGPYVEDWVDLTLTRGAYIHGALDDLLAVLSRALEELEATKAARTELQEAGQ